MERLHRKVLTNRKEALTKGIVQLIGPAPNERICDIGCGDGEIGYKVSEATKANVQGFEVLVRPKTKIPVIPFNGYEIPVPDSFFKIALLIDVLHHDLTPERILKEAARVADTIIIKDHLEAGVWDTLRLRLMDWVGNRHYGVRLPYNYLNQKKWETSLKKSGLKKIGEIAPRHLHLYNGIKEIVFGGNLHILWKLEKI